MFGTKIKKIAMAIMLGGLSIGALSAPAVAQTKVNIGTIKTADSVPVLIAKERGFFEKHNLDVTLTPIALVTNSPSAILSGSIQIGAGTIPALLQTNEAGFGLVAISGVARATKESNPISLVAGADSNIHSAADLVGKKVGVPGLNAIMHVVLQKWLVNNDVNPDDVIWVEAIFPAMKDLLQGQQLDAVAVLEPFRSFILGSKTGYKVADYMLDVDDNTVMAAWMAKRSWAEENEDAIIAFRAAYQEAIDWALANEDEVKKIEAAYLGGPSPIRPAYDLNITAADLELFVGMGTEFGLLRKPVDVNELLWK